MRRDARRHEYPGGNKNGFYIGGTILAIGIIAFIITFTVYGNKVEKQANKGNGGIAELMQESSPDVTNTQAASTRNGENCRRI